MYQSRPVACKLTDFGESRSLLIQTQTVLASKTNNVDRGTVVYMAPELLLKEMALSTASIDDLKLADIWALGMIFSTMINPNLKSLYILEIRSQGGLSSQAELKSFITSLVRSERYPMQDAKYEIARVTVWRELENVLRVCVKLKGEKRFSLDEASAILKRDEDVDPHAFSLLSLLCKHAVIVWLSDLLFAISDRPLSCFLDLICFSIELFFPQIISLQALHRNFRLTTAK